MRLGEGFEAFSLSVSTLEHCATTTVVSVSRAASTSLSTLTGWKLPSGMLSGNRVEEGAKRLFPSSFEKSQLCGLKVDMPFGIFAFAYV